MPITPGPWRVELVPGSYQRPAIVMAGEKVVASCMGNQLEPQAASIREAADNATAISFLPNLIEAIEPFARFYEVARYLTGPYSAMDFEITSGVAGTAKLTKSDYERLRDLLDRVNGRPASIPA